MGFLQVKNHALLTYSKLELFFTLLKLEFDPKKPEIIKKHPIFKELVKYRTILERIRPLDRKMKYQVDKMLKVAVSEGREMDESLNYAPNPDQLVTHDGEGADDEDGDENGGAKDGIYRAPRLASVPYDEEEREQVKLAKKEEQNRKRLQNSTILSELRDEFSERPEQIQSSTGTSVLDKEIAKDEAERKEYEESRFVRLVTSKKEKMRKRQREREAMAADTVGSIDNFAGVQDILSLDKSAHRLLPPKEAKKPKIGSKTGGIFAHVDASQTSSSTVTKKPRRAPPSAGAGSRSTSAPAALVAAAPSTQSTASSSTSGSSGKKKKVVFSNLFG
jgi:U3 small nucleolar ribonucleoprotein protein LCP5